MSESKLGDRLKNKFAEFFEMPKDVVLDMPRISLIGNLELRLENHRGVIEYQQSKIRIRIYKGQVVIVGEGLVIELLTKQSIKVAGEIVDLTFKFH
ncbi:MAG: sporulation protein YqfC [Bacillota bacterium]